MMSDPEKLDVASSLILKDREIRILKARVKELEKQLFETKQLLLATRAAKGGPVPS